MTNHLLGIGTKERFRLGQILSTGMAVITPKTAAIVLEITQEQAAQFLALWAKKGWLSRVKRGVYIPVALQSQTSDVMADDPWILAKALFTPCYIGGWSAAEHWDLTEQIFNSVMVFSTRKVASRELDLSGVKFVVKTVMSKRIFGTKNIWQGNQKIAISDPTRTLVDAFNDPAVVGGIRMAIDILARYMKSEYKNLDLLIEYSLLMENTAIFKRLGFIFEKEHPSETVFMAIIKKEIKSGYSQLDPSTPGTSLITTWGLWVPDLWKKGIIVHD